MAAPTTKHGKCCYTGFKHEGTAQGKITKFAGYDAYVTYPENKSTERAVVFLGDILGINLINSQLLADEWAKKGYFVVMPDLLFGDVVQFNQIGKIDMQKWYLGEMNEKKIAHTPDVIDPIISAVIKELKEKYGAKKIGGAGYCFGAQYVCRFLADPENGFQAGYFVHPGNLTDEEVENVKGPLSIAAAQHDPLFPLERLREVHDILLKKDLPFQINYYQGVRHGFATKGDPNDKVVKWAKENTFEQSVNFFDTFL
ncbi:hypothetical protein KEM56_006693 [Ascosphaera pollenicola]|nr:hypothetical protein KEM56_006693 [Ascosphaera pollenicola]